MRCVAASWAAEHKKRIDQSAAEPQPKRRGSPLWLPILREIGKEYAGKAHVLIIDVWELRELARDYRIQLIPTLVFFDPAGKEVFRRPGVWDKNSIIQKLKEAGMK